MNKNRLREIINSYIINFEMINDKDHEEYYKWQICHEFRTRMDEALAATKEEFAGALAKARNCTENLIDSYTQPFNGLVQFAKEEPETVQQMFRDLYSDDGGDIKVQMKLIEGFFIKCNELLEKYASGSFLFKQDAHSVSSYLFLYDPNHHYMYKATQSQIMADCIEFYDDWGTGNNIKLDVYYRMCDEIIEELKQCPELLETNKSRYEDFPNKRPGELHADEELHILLFDIIYCSHVYEIYDGMTFARPNMKEKKLILEQKKKAQELIHELDLAQQDADKLDEALEYFVNVIRKKENIEIKNKGICEVISVDSKYLKIKTSTGEEKTLSLPIVLVNNMIILNDDEYSIKRNESIDLLKRADSIPRVLDYAIKALEPYKDYIE